MRKCCKKILSMIVGVALIFSASPVTLAIEEDSTHEHIYENGFCSCSDCDSYESAIKVTSENIFELGLSEDYLDYYAVSNAGQLYWFAGLINGTLADIEQDKYANGVLLSNIVVNENVLTSTGALNSDYSSFRVWTPIGDYSDYYNRFYGFFDGQGYTISGLYFNDKTKSNIGLFGHAFNGAINNVGVIDSYFYGNSYVGAICGQYADHYENASPITKLYSDSTVKGAGEMIGGLVGYLYFYAEVINCYNTGSVSGVDQVGGIFGYAQIAGGSDNIITFENCYNIGAVKGSGAYVGGLSGQYEYPESNIAKNCYYLEDCAKDGSNVVQKGIGYRYKGGCATDTKSKMIPISLEKVENGELAYLLQGGNTKQSWGQLSSGAGSHPILTIESKNKVLLAPNGDYSLMGRGDVNHDEVIDVNDYQAQISAVLEDTTDETEFFKCDINEDKCLDVLDVFLLERMING